jgi:hypothetical protein
MLPLEFIFRNITEHTAHLFLCRSDAPHLPLTGRVRGPFQANAHTLPANFKLQTKIIGEIAWSHTTIVDPCPWSPDLPALYKVELTANASDAQPTFDWLGIKRLTTHNKHLLWNTKRWVARGVSVSEIETLCDDLRRDFTVAVVTEVTEPMLQFASQQGVAMILDLAEQPFPTLETLALVARYPAVICVVLGEHAQLSQEIKTRFPQILWAQSSTNMEQPPAAWAQLLWWHVSDSTSVPKLPLPNLPVMLVQHAAYATIADGRAMCDKLQAKWTSLGPIAGFITNNYE